MNNDPITKERAEYLGRMAETGWNSAIQEDQRGNVLLSRNYRQMADDYASRAAAILRKLADKIDPAEVAAVVGVCLCGAVTWVAAWVLT